MKGAGNTIVLIIIGILLIGGLIVSGKLQLQLGAAFEYNGKNCEFIKPEFGRIECEDLSSVIYTPHIWSGDLREEPIIALCGDTENTPSCDKFTFICPKNAVGGGAFVYQSNQEGSCPIGGANWCEYFDYQSNVEHTLYPYVPLGTQVRIGGCGMGALFGGWADGVFREYYIPYGLNVYDAGMKVRYNTQNCGLHGLPWGDKSSLCLTSSGDACSETLSSTAENEDVRNTMILGFDDWVNYLSGWTYAPMDIDNKVVDWETGKAYCQINTIYSIGTFETESTCYHHPKELIGTVECCPGMESANSICGDDFIWHAKIVGECQSDSDCHEKYGYNYYCDQSINECARIAQCFSDLQCPGQGNWQADYAADQPTVIKWKCNMDNKQCEIVERKIVDCVPPTTGCPSGYVCNPATFECEKQEGPSIECGDLVCSRPWEDEQNCPEDCAVGCEWWDIGCNLGNWFRKYGTMAFIIIAVVGVLFLALFLKFGKRR